MQEADCYLEFYFCFTKTEIKFMSHRANPRGLQRTNNYAQVFLSGSSMHLSCRRCRCVLMHIKVRGIDGLPDEMKKALLYYSNIGMNMGGFE